MSDEHFFQLDEDKHKLQVKRHHTVTALASVSLLDYERSTQGQCVMQLTADARILIRCLKKALAELEYIQSYYEQFDEPRLRKLVR